MIARFLTGRALAAVTRVPVAFSAVCWVLCCGCTGSRVHLSPAEIDGADWEAAMRYEPRQTAPAAIDSFQLRAIARSYLGTHYHYGGMSKKGVDCSGLVCLVFQSLNGAELPHSSKSMMKIGKKIPLYQARPGDLLFFRRGGRGPVGHVGIYLGDNRFVHASSTFGVIESGMNDEYYRTHFIQSRRVFP